MAPILSPRDVPVKSGWKGARVLVIIFSIIGGLLFMSMFVYLLKDQILHRKNTDQRRSYRLSAVEATKARRKSDMSTKSRDGDLEQGPKETYSEPLSGGESETEDALAERVRNSEHQKGRNDPEAWQGMDDATTQAELVVREPEPTAVPEGQKRDQNLRWQ